MTEMTEMTDMTITEMVEITEMTLRTEITKMPDMTDMTIDEKDGIYDLDDLDNCRVQCLQSSISAKLARAACMRCHGTKCPLTAFFFLSFSRHYFSSRRSYRRVLKFYMCFKDTKKTKLEVKKLLGATNAPPPRCQLFFEEL